MVQQFTIAARILAGATLALLSIACGAQQPLTMVDRPPSTYTVQKGDTLWGIAGKYLKEPWRWPELWRMNSNDIRNPHVIYPGDVLRLDFVEGQPRLTIARDTVQLSPSTRVS